MTQDELVRALNTKTSADNGHAKTAFNGLNPAAWNWEVARSVINPLGNLVPAFLGIHAGALALYAMLRHGNKKKIERLINNGDLDDHAPVSPKEGDAIGLGALLADTALVKSLAEREGRTTAIPSDAFVPGAVTAGGPTYLLGLAQSEASDQDLDDMDDEWLWNFFPFIGAMRYARRMKRMRSDAEKLQHERERGILGSKTALAPLPRLSTTLRLGVPAFAGQALGGLVQEGLGNDDSSTIEGKKNRINNQLKARGIGALAGILAGVWLGRSGRMRSWKMYR